MRALSGVLALCLALAPLTVQAAPASDVETIERLYDEGRALYETADYDGAIAKWTEAYAMVGDSAESAEIRSTLIYNLASAHEAAFDIDGDLTHLTKSKVLLERFDQSIDELYAGEAIAIERQRVVERLAGIDAKLAAARGEPESEPEPEPEPGVTPEPEPSVTPEPGTETETETDHPRANKPLLIAGSVSLVLGLGGIGAGVAGMLEAQAANEFSEEALGITSDALALRHEQIRYGQQMNALTYAGFIAGGVLVVAGATLLGLSMRDKGRELAAAPALGPGLAGVLVRGSF